MKLAACLIGGPLLGLLLPAALPAQSASTPPLRQPGWARQVAFEYDGYGYFAGEERPSESPSDQVAPVPEDVFAEGVSDSGSLAPCTPCNACCDPRGGGLCRPCNLGDPWTLPQPRPLRQLGLTPGGWIQAGLYGNGYGVSDSGPLGFNNRSGFNLHQLWFFLDRPADTGGYGWDWGFHVDYVFGTDGPDTQAFGDQSWDYGWDSSPYYGSAIPRLYAELAWGDLTVKGGHFYTQHGYEVVQAPYNFFFSHAYAMYYGEPFTHTGFLATWKHNDRLSLQGGWVAGWDTGFENAVDASTFLGGITAQLTEKSTIAWALNAGNFGRDAGNIYMNSIVWTWELAEKWTYVLQHDLGQNTGLGVDNSTWYGINQYLFYELNDCWGAGVRLEWFRDNNGARVIQGNVGDYYEVTLGLNWHPSANLVFRPEVRYDWYNGTFGSGAEPFDLGRASDQVAGGFDMILTF
jgi:hypothetical protein